MACAAARTLCIASIAAAAGLACPPSRAQVPPRPVDSQPIVAGPMLLYPLFDSRFEYTDNLFFQSSDPISSTVTSFTPGISAELPKLRSELQFAYALRYQAYGGADIDDNLSHFAEVDGYFRFGPGLFASFEERFESGVLDTEGFDPGGEITFTADEFTSNALEATFGHERGQASRTGITAGLSRLDFDKREVLPGFFDTETSFVSAFAERRVGTTLWLTGRLSTAQEKLSRPVEIGGTVFTDDRDRDQVRAGAGFRWMRRPGSVLEIDLAYSRDDFEAQAQVLDRDSFRGIVGTIRFSNAVPSRVRLGFVFSRDVFPSVFRTNQYYESNRITGRVDTPVGARVRIGATVSYWENDYPEKFLFSRPSGADELVRREDTTLEERLYVGYLFGGRVEARAYWVNSSRSSIDADFEYDVNRFGVTVRLGG